MTTMERAEELRQQAISLLIGERDQIEAQLALLGYGQEKAPSGKRRGRRPKNLTEPEAPVLDASHS
jgi:hypothetical protein